ncbi:VTT domain-containing protein [Falsarthrobacter nasiphocae]|uniref:Membrane-associated protein n=1 Tax=Falsarthrobacter nasiphocae TaxID=189863 RepID=A0AAE3YGJ1_9MICC|nr:VTT domain-containing protein [Falsarthrobacter nasiphocae]MDR6892800.1 membrane-associated protein [Falsarthrobacter nasiphocae]
MYDISATALVPPLAGFLPSWLDPQVFLADPAIGPWVVLVILAIVFAETGLLVGFFLPGDSLLFTAGLLVATGTIDFPIWLLCLLVFVAAFVGDQVGFMIGRKAGPAIFNRPNSTFFRHEHVEQAHAFFEKHGGKSVILARFVPIVRTFTPVIAGVAQMHYATFVRFNIIGAALWGIGVTLLGYILGDRVPFVRDNLDLIFIIIVLASVVPIVVELLKARRAAKADDAGTPRQP